MTTVNESTWNWNEAPFCGQPDAKRFFTASSQEEALARTHFLVDHRRRLGILEGPAGCGKSMLLDVCARQLQQRGRHVVMLNLMGLDAAEFVWRLAAGLGANPKANSRPLELWRDIEDQLLANRYQRISSVIICDNAEEAEAEVLTLLARLVQFDLVDESRLSIIVSTQITRRQLLGRRLLELCDLRIELETWSEDETLEFLRSSLAASACSANLFSTAAMRRLYALSEGVPRRVQQLSELTLIAASAQDLEEIDEDTVSAVQQELTTQTENWR